MAKLYNNTRRFRASRGVLGNHLYKYQNKEIFMDNLSRYCSLAGTAFRREIVLLKGKPCVWGKCSFCDYTNDNSTDEDECYRINSKTLERVTGEYGSLEVINSGSVFELDKRTLSKIKEVVTLKGIKRLSFECYYSYRRRLDEIRQFFDGVHIIFKCGIETFDDDFRNRVLNKGIHIDSIDDVKRYFDSVCLLVGVKGQTKEMLSRDIRILLDNFKYGCVNVFNNNSTNIKRDEVLIKWFDEEYGDILRNTDGIDYLYNNTDFGVGEL